MFSLFSKLALSEGNGDENGTHIDNLISSSARKFSDLVGDIALLAKDIYVQKNGVLVPVVLISDVPTEMVLVIAFMAARTTLALHYHKTGLIAPLGSIIHTFSLSASQMSEGEFKPSIIFGLPEYGTVSQGSVNFSDQFEFRYLINKENKAFYSCLNFKQAFSAWGFINKDVRVRNSDRMSFVVTEEGLRPLNPSVLQMWVARGIYNPASSNFNL